MRLIQAEQRARRLEDLKELLAMEMASKKPSQRYIDDLEESIKELTWLLKMATIKLAQ
jgi:hypothetical protein